MAAISSHHIKTEESDEHELKIADVKSARDSPPNYDPIRDPTSTTMTRPDHQGHHGARFPYPMALHYGYQHPYTNAFIGDAAIALPDKQLQHPMYQPQIPPPLPANRSSPAGKTSFK